ncbi:hypothetical protein L210DRAFT_3522182 [Boletus edulis BED1]|uniref:Uncharacterized protein n=1 Tax=Boletus edulis BED1 TaxID=1328754 RepID=A0AAD4GLJ0_BOLED|nr:hypothetical protein L210DRAFT_3522182 [Boletus edulis BED1]
MLQAARAPAIYHLSVGRWLGPMPIEEFFREFLPSPDKPLPTFAFAHNKLQLKLYGFIPL